MDHDDGQADGLELQDQGRLVAAGGLQEDAFGPGLGQKQAALADALGVVVIAGGRALRQQMQVEVAFGNVDSDGDHRFPFLAYAGSWFYNGPGDCSGF